MKWIGQHIWDFISRFRSDVYMEAIESGTIASGGNLGLDSNNKIVKADTESGELSFDGSTANGILTYKDADEISVESTLTYNSDALTASSSSSGKPFLTLSNTNADAAGSFIQFDKVSIGADDDVLGSIVWGGKGDDNGPVNYASIVGSISDATATEEAGKLDFKVAEFDGTLSTGLSIDGDTDVNGMINVSVGLGQGSQFLSRGYSTFSSYVTIANGSTTGQPALYINNLDADQSAIKIEGANTSAAIVDIDASALTTGPGIYINDDTYERAVGHIKLDITDTLQTTLNRGSGGMFIVDYERPSGSPVAVGQTLEAVGAYIRMDDNAANDGTFSQTGLSVYVDSASTNGNITNTGITTRVGGGDTNKDIKMINDADDSEYATVSVGAGGAVKIETTSDDTTGDITLDAAGDIHLEVDGGDVYGDAGNYNFSSTGPSRPTINLINNADDATGGFLNFTNNRDGSGLQDSDTLGTITFIGDDAAGGVEQYGSITGSIIESDHGDESGQIAIKVANDGTERNGIIIKGDKSTAEEVDVVIANGAASTTSIAGNLEIVGVAGKGIPWHQTMSGYKTSNSSTSIYYFPYRGATGESWSNNDSSPTSINQYDASAGFMIAPRNGTITNVKIQGYVTGSTDDFKFYFLKGPMTNNSTSISLANMFNTSAISPTTTARTWSHTEDFSSSNTFDEDDILFCMIKKDAHTSSSNHYFTITVSGYWTEN